MPDKVYVVVHWMAYEPSMNVFASLDKEKAEAEAERLTNELDPYYKNKKDPSMGYEVDELELQ